MPIQIHNVKENIIKLISIVLCIAVFVGDVLINMVQWEKMATFRTGHMVITFFCLLWVSTVYYRRKKKYSIPVFLYFIWLILSRLAHGDMQSSVRGELCCAAEMYIAFRIGYAFDADGQKKLLKWFTVVIAGILTLWAVCGLVVILTDVAEIPLFDVTIHLRDELQDTGVLRFLELFAVHRNESAAWFMIALWLVVGQYLETTKKIWKVVLVIDGLLMFLMIAVQHCRSVYVVTAGGFGMLVFLLLIEQKWKAKMYVRMAAAVVAALVCTVIVYKGFSVCNKILVDGKTVTVQTLEVLPREQKMPEENTAAKSTEVTFTEPVVDEQPTEILPVDTKSEIVENNDQLIDNRSFWNDLRTLTMRTEVWGAVYNTILLHPEFLAWGQPEGEIGLNLQRYGGMTREISHTHNMLVQVLSLAGIPGLFIILLFCVRLVISALRCYFGRAYVSQKILVIPVACLMIYGIMEPLLTAQVEFSSVCFMLLSGVLSQNRYNRMN